MQDSIIALTEQALRVHPGDALILHFAATAALLEERPDRALIFSQAVLQTLRGECDLLHAVALAQQNKLARAREILQRYELDSPCAALRVFPGGRARGEWLVARCSLWQTAGRPPAFADQPALGPPARGA
jgi:hypothetical protein